MRLVSSACLFAITLLGVNLGTAHASSTSTPFPANSLIIPTSASFQDNCGAVSAYGLVYDVLRAEPWLLMHGYGLIAIDLAVSDTKSSPNRCTPTSNSTAPNGLAGWSDGCDFSLSGTGPLVKQVNLTSPGAGNDNSFSTIDSTTNPAVFPGYASVPVAAATSVSYMGAPFVVSATGLSGNDADTFLKLIAGSAHGGFDAQDTDGNTIDFSAFRTTGTCSFGSTHHVNIHRAQVAFTAPIRKFFTSQPPRLAVLETDTSHLTSNIAPGILENYLQNGGLTFSGAQGTPGGSAGQIFDVFDVNDLVTNKLALTVAPGVNRYAMLWTPHWVGNTPLNANEQTAMANIKTFLDQQTGLMGECASISTYEGNEQNGGTQSQAGLQLQTCHGVAGACSGGTTYGIDRNPAGVSNNTTLPNCSDPGSTATQCIQFGAPTDEFVQVADYLWNSQQGHIVNFDPLAATGSIFQPGVVPLIAAYNGGSFSGYLASRNIKDNTPGKANILYLGGHNQTNSVAGTKMALETLLLLGVSSLTPPTTTTETSRSTPIAATLGNGDTAIVLGTFDNVQPPQPVPVVAASADLAAWKFPFVKGHLRATLASTITTSVQALNAGTIEFDASAAGMIPAVTFTGCGTNFTGNCRTVFTTTTVPSTVTGIALHPANVFVTEGNAATLGPLMSVGSTLSTTADYTTLIDRTLAGIFDPVSNTWKSALGGIDRSTVAVIGTSTLANGSRATMAYVGASDGMLHAICAGVDSAHGCPSMGTELWAFLPRVQLPAIRTNTSYIQGSPRVVDAFIDPTGSGTKSFRTVLTFQTGSGDPTNGAAAQPAIYALDITNPQSPFVIWEYSIANPGAARGADALGLGLSLAAGAVNINGVTRNIVVAETSNGGTNGAADATAGVVVSGLDMETGSPLWTNPFIYAYPSPTRFGGTLVPHTGVPGGAVGVDKQGQGFITDIVFGDLYGNVWELDAATGLSRYPTKKPLFSFTTDYHSIGAVPAIYSNGSQDFAVIVSGGYYDPSAALSWGHGVQQGVVAIALNAPAADVTLHETSPTSDIPFKYDFATTSESGFAQAQIVGGQLFVTTDSTDVNASAYGTGGVTGSMYTSNLSATTTVVAIQGGASSVANTGTSIYTASSNKEQQLASATSTVGAGKVDTFASPRLSRLLWLRTQ